MTPQHIIRLARDLAPEGLTVDEIASRIPANDTLAVVRDDRGLCRKVAAIAAKDGWIAGLRGWDLVLYVAESGCGLNDILDSVAEREQIEDV